MKGKLAFLISDLWFFKNVEAKWLMMVCFVIISNYADLEWEQYPQSSMSSMNYYPGLQLITSSPKSSNIYQHHFHIKKPLIILLPRTTSGCIATHLKHPNFISSFNNNPQVIKQSSKYDSAEFDFQQVKGTRQNTMGEVNIK